MHKMAAYQIKLDQIRLYLFQQLVKTILKKLQVYFKHKNSFLNLSWTSAFEYCCGQKKKPKETAIQPFALNFSVKVFI